MSGNSRSVLVKCHLNGFESKSTINTIDATVADWAAESKECDAIIWQFQWIKLYVLNSFCRLHTPDSIITHTHIDSVDALAWIHFHLLCDFLASLFFQQSASCRMNAMRENARWWWKEWTKTWLSFRVYSNRKVSRIIALQIDWMLLTWIRCQVKSIDCIHHSKHIQKFFLSDLHQPGCTSRSQCHDVCAAMVTEKAHCENAKRVIIIDSVYVHTCIEAKPANKQFFTMNAMHCIYAKDNFGAKTF